MGQRLNIEIHRGEETLANCYYHWSGFTSSSFELTVRIVAAIEADRLAGKIFPSHLVEAIRLLEVTGARMEADEMKHIPANYDEFKFEAAQNRNDGMISVSPEGIESVRQWEEARVVIDLDERTVDFGVFIPYHIDNYLDDYGDEATPLEELHALPYDPTFETLTFTEFLQLAREYEEFRLQHIYVFRVSKENLILAIE